MKNFSKAIAIAAITAAIVFSVSFVGAGFQDDLNKQYNIHERIQNFNATK